MGVAGGGEEVHRGQAQTIGDTHGRMNARRSPTLHQAVRFGPAWHHPARLLENETTPHSRLNRNKGSDPSRVSAFNFECVVRRMVSGDEVRFPAPSQASHSAVRGIANVPNGKFSTVDLLVEQFVPISSRSEPLIVAEISRPPSLSDDDPISAGGLIDHRRTRSMSDLPAPAQGRHRQADDRDQARRSHPQLRSPPNATAFPNADSTRALMRLPLWISSRMSGSDLRAFDDCYFRFSSRSAIPWRGKTAMRRPRG